MSITFKKRNHGNLGNQLFQHAFMIGLQKKHNLEMVLPQWRYAEFFESPPTSDIPSEQFVTTHKLVEQHFHYTPDYWDQYVEEFKTHPYDILCWGQSEKYFEHCKADVYTAFMFNNTVKGRAVNKMPLLMQEGKVNIAISVRQGDYVGNPNYELMPIKFYLLALLEYFPDFRENANLFIFSDDIPYCKLHFGCLSNVTYAEDMTDIEQICAGSMCDHAIIANSTFSWWMAWLIEYGVEGSTKIICPNFLFANAMSRNNDSSDFYPTRWHKLDHKIKRIDLTNTTFTIPVHDDSRDRKENANLSIKYLRENFDTTIVVGEQGSRDFGYLKDIVDYRLFDEMKDFHRTKMLNDMAADAKTPVVVNWDCDVIVPPLQIVESVRSILEDKQEMVYPYDGRFARVPRAQYRLLDERVDVGCLKGLMFNGMRPADAKSVGGAIFWDSQAFLRAGLENENMISYGPEDAERYDRALKLGVRIHRIPGVIYHVDHILSVNSSVKHPKYPENVRELEKIRSLTKIQLEAYVDTWSWAQKYTPSYYESIFEESVKSRDAVFKVLQQLEVLKDGMGIIDVGSGLGQWGFEAKEKFGIDYIGIDFGVPEHKLVISKYQYYDHDLRTPISDILVAERYDLVLCLEVAEHLPLESADQLIETLTRLGDTILFSAAVPCQGGIDHRNEQWQSWWADKFRERGYFANDFRSGILNNNEIAIWYQQNTILYSKKGQLWPLQFFFPQMDFIHPQMYMNLMKHYRILK